MGLPRIRVTWAASWDWEFTCKINQKEKYLNRADRYHIRDGLSEYELLQDIEKELLSLPRGLEKIKWAHYLNTMNDDWPDKLHYFFCFPGRDGKVVPAGRDWTDFDARRDTLREALLEDLHPCTWSRYVVWQKGREYPDWRPFVDRSEWEKDDCSEYEEEE